MDSDDIGYNTVGWDTYSPANPHEDSRLSSGAENRLHRSHLHASGFEGSDDDDDDIPSLSAAASTAILPAETSAWADEPLDNEVIDINGTGVNISSSPHNNNSFASNMFSQDNPNSDDDDPPERQPSQQPYSVSTRMWIFLLLCFPLLAYKAFTAHTQTLLLTRANSYHIVARSRQGCETGRRSLSVRVLLVRAVKSNHC